MSKPSEVELLKAGAAALAAGHWVAAQTAYRTSRDRAETAEACYGLAVASWWLGENRASVDLCTRAYALFRRSADIGRSVQCAVWLCIVHKSNFANSVAASGWAARADRLLAGLEPGTLHGWVAVARAYRMTDLISAEQLTERALELGRSADDVDLELVAMSQLGLIRVGQGQTATGFALIDESMAAALAGESPSLDTVVYICCDMLNACELTDDLERAAQWCQVADDFVARYGCPFLYAECRIYYGSILTAKGRWAQAERELDAGLRMTVEISPGLHGRAVTRLANLRVRQGRLEDAERLLNGAPPAVVADDEAILCRAALLLARGEPFAVVRSLDQRQDQFAQHASRFAEALGLLADAHLEGGDLDAATASGRQLTERVGTEANTRLGALAAGVRGRLAAARGDSAVAVPELQAALSRWAALGLPLEVARARVDLARVQLEHRPDAAIEHARSALGTFDSLGASLDADRAAALLRSLGVVARTGRKGVGRLTDRELEVLKLLGAGLSNPEIADRLFVSRKTAAHHVSNILAKLQLRNRAEAAAYAVGTLGSAPTDTAQHS